MEAILEVVLCYRRDQGKCYWLSGDIGTTDRRDATVFGSEDVALQEWMHVREKIGMMDVEVMLEPA